MVVDVMMIVLTFPLLLGSAVHAKTCENHPTVWSSTVRSKSRRDDVHNARFGDDVTILCSAASGQLKINNDVDLKTDTINKTTVQLIVRRPDVGKHEYRCIEIVTQCEETLIFKVLPAMSVSSPRARKIPRNKEHKDTLVYFIPRGNIFKVLCSANDIQSYSILVKNGQKMLTLETKTLNKTTLAFEALANDSNVYYYFCKSNKDKAPEFVIVKTDYTTEAQNFRCVFYESLKFECSWITSSKMNSDKLWFLHKDNSQTLLCSHISGETAKVCSSNINLPDVMSLNLTVRLQTCNQVLCDNQTFYFDIDMITKLDPPSGLKVLNTSTSSAVLTWRSLWNSNSVFKVEYRLIATSWRQVNTSEYVCEKEDCSFVLNLPCSDMNYEVRVYVKKKSAEKQFWSEPSDSTYFFTEPKTTGVWSGQVCDEALLEPEPIISVETALSEINKLIRHTIKKKLSLKETMSSLKQKVAEVNALRELAKV